jgi:Pyruvate kinase
MLNLPEIKTKIVCTIGPASSDEETIKKMIQNGMNIARLTFLTALLNLIKKS